MSTTAAAYFRNIYDNVTSIAIGMKITLKYCFQKTVTVQYPEQHLTFAPRYRGIHEFELEKCIACDMCAKACPVDCIYIDKSGPRKIDKKTGKVNMSDPKNGELLRYAIDYSKCLFCALCTEPCPTDCIHMGKLHDLSSYSREDGVVEHRVFFALMVLLPAAFLLLALRRRLPPGFRPVLAAGIGAFHFAAGVWVAVVVRGNGVDVPDWQLAAVAAAGAMWLAVAWVAR